VLNEKIEEVDADRLMYLPVSLALGRISRNHHCPLMKMLCKLGKIEIDSFEARIIPLQAPLVGT
jgi:hypothetical protein